MFAVSDGFCQDVQSSTTSTGDRCAVTRYVYNLMHSEYVDKSCRHYRSIPILLPRTNCDNVPLWLKNTYLYVWPKQYKELYKLLCNHKDKLHYNVH